MRTIKRVPILDKQQKCQGDISHTAEAWRINYNRRRDYGARCQHMARYLLDEVIPLCEVHAKVWALSIVLEETQRIDDEKAQAFSSNPSALARVRPMD